MLEWLERPRHGGDRALEARPSVPQGGVVARHRIARQPMKPAVGVMNQGVGHRRQVVAGEAGVAHGGVQELFRIGGDLDRVGGRQGESLGNARELRRRVGHQ